MVFQNILWDFQNEASDRADVGLTVRFDSDTVPVLDLKVKKAPAVPEDILAVGLAVEDAWAVVHPGARSAA
jgi:hypothetical protein